MLDKGDMLSMEKRYLNEEELKIFLNKIKVYVSDLGLSRLYKEYVVDKTKITRNELKNICHSLLKKNEVKDLYKRFCVTYDSRDMEDTMGYEEWSKFLEEVQGDKMDKRYFQEMMAQLKNPQSILGFPRTNTSQFMNFIEFGHLIFSDYNLAMNPTMDKVFQDMDRPMAEYYINTLNNTYYGGNQMTGSSSCLAYYEALKIGCRCLEIDTWDGAKGDPIVASPKNMTSMILFEDVARCLSKWAFKHSEYPLVIFIENHCDMDQMIKVKNIINKYFADSILRVSEKEFLKDTFPSPSKIMKKVVFRSKCGYSHKKFTDRLIERNKARDEYGRSSC